MNRALSPTLFINHPFQWWDDIKAILLRMQAIMQIFSVCNKPHRSFNVSQKYKVWGICL